MKSTKSTAQPRKPPHSKESEMMVLGSMLSSVNALNQGADALEPDDFYFLEHRLVFVVLKEAYRNDRPADVHLVCEELKRRGELDRVGGVAYVMTLAQYAASSAYLDEYASIVRDKSILRRVAEAASTIEREALHEPQDVEAFLDESQAKLYKVSQLAHSKEGVSVRDLLVGLHSELPYLKQLQEKQEEFLKHGSKDGHITGLSTHFVDLDKIINGLLPSQLLILAARPSMGKTALALNIAQNVAFRSKIPVGIFSLEMNAEELLHRLICSEAEVESDKIRTGALNGMEYQKIVAAVHEMEKHVLVIDDQPGIRVSDLRSRARRMQEVYGIRLLVIDYLQLLSGAKNHYHADSRQSEISEISRMLKNLARELNIPILCLSQLSRKVEERQGHRPMLSDLRESGSIEQDADIVMFLFRREYYNPTDKPGMAELIIAKNRHGRVGDVMLTYKKTIALFMNYTAAQPDIPTSSAFQSFQPR